MKPHRKRPSMQRASSKSTSSPLSQKFLLEPSKSVIRWSRWQSRSLWHCLWNLRLWKAYPQVCDVHWRFDVCHGLGDRQLPLHIANLWRVWLSPSLWRAWDSSSPTWGLSGAFAHCESLASMTVPKSVKCMEQFVTDSGIVRCLCTLQVFGEHDYPPVCAVHGRVRHRLGDCQVSWHIASLWRAWLSPSLWRTLQYVTDLEIVMLSKLQLQKAKCFAKDKWKCAFDGKLVEWRHL